MNDKRPLIYFIPQIVFAGFIVITGPVFTHNIAFLLTQFFGIMLIFWALLSQKLNQTKRHAKSPKGIFLSTKGPYEIIRHPIYAGFLLLFFALVENSLGIIRLFIYVLLIVTTLFKIAYDENMVEKEFKEYDEYKTKTHKLIPYLF